MRAAVSVDGERVAAIDAGLLVLLGVAAGDGAGDAAFIARKLARLRIFADGRGLMNLSVADIGGAVLLVSQFTLLADTRRGNRPSFTAAAAPETAERLYKEVAQHLRRGGLPVDTGMFGGSMQVELVNDGPVTILLNSRTEDPAVR